jgi:ribosome maturation factor RimP
MEIASELRTLAESCLGNESQFLVDVLITARQGPKKVLVMVDADNGIGIDEFSEISRKLSGLLDESGLIDGKYSLEVSSPGIDQPLKSVRQYRKNVGRKLKIKSKGEILEGTLESVSENFVELALVIGTGKKKETSIVQIPFSEIEKAFVLVSFK